VNSVLCFLNPQSSSLETLAATVKTMTSRKILILSIKIILTPFIIVAVHLIYNYSRIQMDGIDAEIFCLNHSEDTRYAQDYSDSAFNKIEVGMPKKQVLDLIGAPIYKYFIAGEKISADSISDNSCYHYSISDSDTNFRDRIIFFKGGIAVRVIKKFYYD
jgi:hypothetical protein